MQSIQCEQADFLVFLRIVVVLQQKVCLRTDSVLNFRELAACFAAGQPVYCYRRACQALGDLFIAPSTIGVVSAVFICGRAVRRLS